MENPISTHESIDALRRHESRIDWLEEKRFKEDCAALAKDNPDLDEWLKEHGGRLA